MRSFSLFQAQDDQYNPLQKKVHYDPQYQLFLTQNPQKEVSSFQTESMDLKSCSNSFQPFSFSSPMFMSLGFQNNYNLPNESLTIYPPANLQSENFQGNIFLTRFFRYQNNPKWIMGGSFLFFNKSKYRSFIKPT